MFVKIDKQTKKEEIITSAEMVRVLVADLKPGEDVDEALTDMVLGTYEHSNASARYIYRA